MDKGPGVHPPGANRRPVSQLLTAPLAVTEHMVPGAETTLPTLPLYGTIYKSGLHNERRKLFLQYDTAQKERKPVKELPVCSTE